MKEIQADSEIPDLINSGQIPLTSSTAL